MRPLHAQINNFTLDSQPNIHHCPKRVDVVSEFKIRGNLWRNVKRSICMSVVRWLLEAEEYE